MATILRPRFGASAGLVDEASVPARTILHVDLDCFFVSVERVLNPSLAQVPVVVGGDPDARGVVTSASREARAQGVHAGMPSAVARRLCPEATFLPGRGRLYARAATGAQRILREVTPDVERASIDEAYLDVTSAVASGQAPLDLAASIQDALSRRLGLPSSIGIGTNKVVAKVACQRAKPEGIVEVWRGYERTFLGPLPVGDLPGVGPVLEERLRLFGLRTVSDVARVDRTLLEATFGAVGARLADMAHGICEEAVSTVDAPRSIGRERTFPQDVRDADRLMDEVYVMSGVVAARLRSESVRARTITLKLRTADFRTVTRSRTIAPTDQSSEIAGVACFLLREMHVGDPVRLVGVQASGLTDEAVQEELFADEPIVATGPAGPPAAQGTAALDRRVHETRVGGLTVRWHARV